MEFTSARKSDSPRRDARREFVRSRYEIREFVGPAFVLAVEVSDGRISCGAISPPGRPLKRACLRREKERRQREIENTANTDIASQILTTDYSTFSPVTPALFIPTIRTAVSPLHLLYSPIPDTVNYRLTGRADFLLGETYERRMYTIRANRKIITN